MAKTTKKAQKVTRVSNRQIMDMLTQLASSIAERTPAGNDPAVAPITLPSRLQPTRIVTQPTVQSPMEKLRAEIARLQSNGKAGNVVTLHTPVAPFAGKVYRAADSLTPTVLPSYLAAMQPQERRVLDFVVKHPNCKAIDIELGLGMKRKSVESAVWRLRRVWESPDGSAGVIVSHDATNGGVA